MAGSNRRRNIQGHTLQADPEIVAKFQRLSSVTLGNLFRQARDQGSVPVRLDDEPFTLVRHSDHTYTILPRDPRNHPVL